MNDEDLFHLALEKPAGERSDFLDRACAGDVTRRRRVEVLLRSHETPDSFLARPAVDPRSMADLDKGLTTDVGSGRPDEEITCRSSPAEGSGSHIGPYKLLQQLGEGGMGTVFMAEQAQPVRRKVALKVIKPGMDSRQVIARFEAERQALAMMDHVNIARVLDAGATDSGRPFFVMELIHGVPITKYCDDNRLTPRERLELFVQVCQAIQHAHQKGIIHRDLKPSNVMITLYDDKPMPKVIDFGVAKATEQSLTERTLFTQYGTMVGTFEYMSPEQAELSALGVDTRSDIYSLGVLLYELLTGTTPLSHKRVREAAYAEILRMIKEEDPPKPSTRLSDSGEALASISAQRHTEPARLTRLVRGELDWIVMKTLEKDRNRRYETTNDFSADVQRYLNDEAVEACPPSSWYCFRKFARRNKAALMTAVTVSLAALVAVGSMGWAIRDRSARQAKLNDGVEIATQEAGLARDRALTLMDHRYRWEATLAAAVSALERAEELATQDEAAISPTVRRRLKTLRASLDSDERDRGFVARFDEILEGVIVWNARRSQLKSEEAFFQIKNAFQSIYGIELGVTPPAEVAAFIHDRPKPIRQNVLTSLDVCLTRVPGEERSAQQWLAQVLMTADADPWRERARHALATGDGIALEKLVTEQGVASQSPAFLHLVSSHLPVKDTGTKGQLLRLIQQTYPGEFWAHGRFAVAMSHDLLAWHLATIADPPFRDVEQALELAKEAVRVVPKDGDFWNTLGVAHYRVGNMKDAIASLEKAMELSKGGDGTDWYFLAMAHWRLDNKAEARKWFDKALGEKDDANAAPYYREELRRFRAEAADVMGVNAKKD